MVKRDPISSEANEIESLYALRALMTNAASAADSRLFQQKCIMHRRRRRPSSLPPRRKIWILPVGKFRLERALRATEKGRSSGRASARRLVIKVPPCTVIPESGYPFSGTPVTIKLLLLARALLSRRLTDRPTDQIYFAVYLAAETDGVFRRWLRGMQPRVSAAAASARIHGRCGQSPDSATNIRLVFTVWYYRVIYSTRVILRDSSPPFLSLIENVCCLLIWLQSILLSSDYF